MRSSALPFSVLACLGIAGCTSSSGVDDFVPRPSNEVTSSISQPDAALPKAEVAEAVADEPEDDAEAQQPVAEAVPQDKPEPARGNGRAMSRRPSRPPRRCRR